MAVAAARPHVAFPVAARSHFIVTGDRPDPPPFGTDFGIAIISPRWCPDLPVPDGRAVPKCLDSENNGIDGEKAGRRPRNEPRKKFLKSYPAPARKGGIGTQGAPETKPQNAVLSEISAPCEMMRLLAEESEKAEYPRQGSNLRPTV